MSSITSSTFLSSTLTATSSLFSSSATSALNSTSASSSDLSSPTSLSPPSGDNGNDNNNNNSQSNGNFAASTSLYLFTFLATLLLLLAISIAIVIRSFIIRRRFQRQVQEALAQGLVPPSPPGGAGSRRWDIGEKPILWDTHLYPEAYDTRWSKMMPVSAKILGEKVSGSGKPVLDGREQIRRAYTSSDLALHPPRPRWLPPFLRSNGTNSGSSQPTLNSDTNSSSPTNANNDNNDNSPIYEDARLQVGVMIALPSRYRPRAWDAASKGKAGSSETDEEEEVPDVMIGVTDVPWKVQLDNSSANNERPSPSS